MRMYDIITSKKHGNELTDEEIRFVVEGFTSGEIPDYQMSALVMAICLQGMNTRETAALTLAMAYSGDTVKLDSIEGVKVDKHSTGGVGDKTTLIVSPIVAACGVVVAKMSGRGLGHTGGTVDKLESIPGMNLSLSEADFFRVVRETGLCVAGQSGDLAPADKKIYALRDATATVDSIPLIAASIMSKKLAAGADKILLDVKTGSGAFMKTQEDALALAKVMVDLGEAAGRETAALVTNMDAPLGVCIGNALEVKEAVEVLRGHGAADLTAVCIALATEMLALAGKGAPGECERMAREAIASGCALQKLADMVEAQGGDRQYIETPELFPEAKYTSTLEAPTSGYIVAMNAEACGIVSSMLGAGRQTVEKEIDHAAGLVLRTKVGDWIEAGGVIADLHSTEESCMAEAKAMLLSAVVISGEKPMETPLVLARVTKRGVECGSF